MWSLFGSILTAEGKYELADEALSEAITKDARAANGWALYAVNHLKRLQTERHLIRQEYGLTSKDEIRFDPTDFVEADHAFQRAMQAPTPCQDIKLLVELGRLWLLHDRLDATEQCYNRALLIENDPSIRTKLNWLLQQKSGNEPEAETKAATLVQSAIRGAIARKEVKKKKKRMQQQLDQLEEEEEKIQYE